jgi:uncharacterized protein
LTQPSLAVQIATELALRPDQVAGAMALLDAANTVPFIARYRKEATGGLDEVQLRQVQARLTYLRNLHERRQAVLASIAEQGSLTPELETAIQAATTLQQVEDLYLPFRPRRRTRAMIARERGLEPLADLLLSQPDRGPAPLDLARDYVQDEVPTAEDALAGARDIIAEQVSDDATPKRRAC